MFVDFKNVLDTSRKTIPFGIAQIGKAFRNRLPRELYFRTREFEQMEIEYFIKKILGKKTLNIGERNARLDGRCWYRFKTCARNRNSCRRQGSLF